MKKIFGVLALFALLCGFSTPSFAAVTPLGFIYQNTVSPGDGFNAVAPSREGRATCKNIFFFVAVGDCSVREAMRKGGITQLSHYDVQRENIMGIQTITVRAYGR